MYIHSIENQKLLNQYDIVELKVRGKEDELQEFFSDIQDEFDLAHDEWTKRLGMLTMTFDKKPKIQTLRLIQRYTKDYIEAKAQ
ncbi:hypothetical protein CN918_29275 [Priestia megaterium]|nr:hypothetical protein CN918_29275 [Priestia megaterium]